MVHFVCVAVVDPHGRVLLQERDDNTVIAPDQWCLPGGGLEEGEPALAAAVRELAEETGVDLAPDVFTDLGEFHVDISGPLDFRVFATRADLGNADVTCPEGRQMVFVDRGAIDALDLAESTRIALPAVDRWWAQVHEPAQLVGVVLVDRRGRLLLQERDEHPALDPEKWGLPGGHLDPGEDFEAGAYRELAEETGVHLPPGSLDFWREYAVHGGRMQVFVAGCDLTDADIDCQEGRQIVFVEPSPARLLDLGQAAAQVVPELLGSETYAALVRDRR